GRGRAGNLRGRARTFGGERQDHVARRYSVADSHVELADAARSRRRHVHRGLFGLERYKTLFRGDVVAGLHEDLDDLYVREITKVRYDDFHDSVSILKEGV